MEALSSNEKAFIEASADEGLRIDGRGLYDYRKLGINFLKARGQVEVSLGDSLVFCAVDISMEKPFADRPNEGFLSFAVNFLPMAHPRFEQVLGSNPSQKSKRFRNEFSQEIERVLEKSIKKTRALNTESLCVVSSKYAWNVAVSVHILANHGNLIDLCTQACILALMHARVPDVKVFPDRSIEVLKVFKPLSLHFLTVSVTFGFLTNGQVILDPEIREEKVLDGKVVICMNVYGDILTLQKSGGAALRSEVVMQCLDIALIKTKEITALLRQAVEKTAVFDPQQEKVSQRTGKLWKEIQMS